MKKINKVNIGLSFVGPAVTCQNDYEKENQGPLTKAELLQEGIFFLLQLFARDVLVMLEIEKTKPTFIT